MTTLLADLNSPLSSLSTVANTILIDIPSTHRHRVTADNIPPPLRRRPLIVDGRSSATIPYDVEQIKTDTEECSDSDLVWDVEGMCDMQKDIIATLFDTYTSNNIIAKFPTGSGKSHVIRVVGHLHTVTDAL